MAGDDPRAERFAAWRRRRWLGRKPIGEPAWRSAAVTVGIRDFDFETLTIESAGDMRHVRVDVVGDSRAAATLTKTRQTSLEELTWPSVHGQV